jgi:hypothetical protein
LSGLKVNLPPGRLVVVAAPPALLTQKNVEAATGIPASAFLQLVRAYNGRVGRKGKLRAVEREPFLDWFLRRQAPQNDAGKAGDAVEARLQEELDLSPAQPVIASTPIPDEDARLLACDDIDLRWRVFFGVLTREGLRVRKAYADLWDAINGERVAWKENPWVWVLLFRRVLT